MHPDPYYPLARPVERPDLDRDCHEGSFAHGVFSAFLLFWIGVAIIAMIYVIISHAFAGAVAVPEACTNHPHECAAALAEARL